MMKEKKKKGKDKAVTVALTKTICKITAVEIQIDQCKCSLCSDCPTNVIKWKKMLQGIKSTNPIKCQKSLTCQKQKDDLGYQSETGRHLEKSKGKLHKTCHHKNAKRYK